LILVGRGGVEPPTFRFSGPGTGPRHHAHLPRMSGAVLVAAPLCGPVGVKVGVMWPGWDSDGRTVVSVAPTTGLGPHRGADAAVPTSRSSAVWIDTTTVHLTLAGRHHKTLPSRLTTVDLARLRAEGARTAGPPPVRRRTCRAVHESRRRNASPTSGLS